MNYLVADEWLFHDRPSGSSRVAWGVACAVRDRGHRVAYLCCGEAGADGRRCEVRDGITVVRYAYPQLNRWNPLRLQAHIRAAASEGRKALGTISWDVVHSHTLAPGLAAYLVAGPKARKVATIHSPTILEQRTSWAEQGALGKLKLLAGEPLLRRAEKHLLGRAHALTALSHFTKQSMTEMYGEWLGSRIAVIPFWASQDESNAGKTQARAQLNWRSDVPAIFTLRRLVARMGIDTLIDAVHAIPPQVVFRLYIGGEGPDRSGLQARAQAGPGRSRMMFLGRMTDENVRAAYRAADLFVIPTRALECFGIIALEALAAGCPVLASRAGALPEVVGPLLPGLMFDPGDTKQLTRLITSFLSGEVSVPGARALQAYVEKRFGRREIERRYLDVLEGQCSARATCAS